MTTYRLTAIGWDLAEREVGILGTLTAPPGSILVMSVPRDTMDADLARLRAEWRELTNGIPEWGNRPTIVVRAGDLKFAVLVPTEEETRP